MVKRDKSPEVVENVRMFAVYLPYPLNGDLVNEEDQIACAYWVADVIGNPEYLLNIHRMPSARGMILLEISKEFTEQGLLLGEHQWRRFLKNPLPDEVGRRTCVFHSTYSTTREAHKAGWRPIFVQTRWFKDWRRGRGDFVHPYPETSWCPPPPEDKTNRLVCRPLPVEYKPPPPSVAPPVVGSPAWIAQQQEEKPTKAVLKSAWKKQNLSVKVGETSNKHTPPPSAGSGKPRSAGPASATPEPSPRTPNLTPLGSASGSAKRGWGKPVPLNRFTSNPPSASSSQAPWAGQIKKSASASGAKSPFTEQPPVGPQNAWAKQLKIVPEKEPKIIPFDAIDDSEWGKPSTDSWYDMAEEEFGSYDVDVAGGIEDDIAREPSPEPAPPTPMTGNAKSGNKRRGLKGGKGPSAPEPLPVQVNLQGTTSLVAYEALDDEDEDEGLEGILKPWEKIHISEHGSTTGDDDNSPTTPPDDTATGSKEVTEDNEWKSAWAMEEDPQKKQAPEIVCPTHRLSCPRKICIDYQNEERRLKKIKEREARMEEEKNGGGRGRGRGRQGGNRNWRNQDEGDNQDAEGGNGFQTARPRGRTRW